MASGKAPSSIGLGGEALLPPLVFCARHSWVETRGWTEMLFLALEAPVSQILKVEMWKPNQPIYKPQET